MLLTLAILTIMYTWNEGTKLERTQRRHMQPADCLPGLRQLHDDDTVPYFADNIVYLTSDPDRMPSTVQKTVNASSMRLTV